MPSTYSIAITGIKAGFESENAIKQLAELLKVTDEKVTSMLESRKFLVKSGVDLNTAAKYESALQRCGCDCIVAPEEETNTEELVFDLPEFGKHAQANYENVKEHSSADEDRHSRAPGGLNSFRTLVSGEKGVIAGGVLALAIAFLVIVKPFQGAPDQSSSEDKVQSDIVSRCVEQALDTGYDDGQCAFGYINTCVTTQSRSEMEKNLATDRMLGMNSGGGCVNMPATYVNDFNKIARSRDRF